MTENAPEAATESTTDEQPSVAPPPPVEPVLATDDPKTHLQTRLRALLVGLPAFFEFNNHVAGVEATDLHALNTLLGASIEGQVVKALNQQRGLWDPDDEWLGYIFERQSQRFPDVLLTKKGGADGPDIALGIELKGWFLLAKEGVPSFRFGTTPAACADHDLLVVVPWYLDNVLSGSPVAAEPFVVSAKWAAEYRNHYWRHMRKVKAGVDTSIESPQAAHPYPGRDVHTWDRPGYDGGANFGRVARVAGLMDGFVTQSNDLEVLGISVGDWNWFLRLHSDQADPAAVRMALFKELTKRQAELSDAKAKRLLPLVQSLIDEWNIDELD